MYSGLLHLLMGNGEKYSIQILIMVSVVPILSSITGRCYLVLFCLVLVFSIESKRILDLCVFRAILRYL